MWYEVIQPEKQGCHRPSQTSRDSLSLEQIKELQKSVEGLKSRSRDRAAIINAYARKWKRYPGTIRRAAKKVDWTNTEDLKAKVKEAFEHLESIAGVHDQYGRSGEAERLRGYAYILSERIRTLENVLKRDRAV